MIELTQEELSQVEGGLPVVRGLKIVLKGLEYIGAVQAAIDFGDGFIDGLTGK